jgi:RND family efflux transporter MFP subunit
MTAPFTSWLARFAFVLSLAMTGAVWSQERKTGSIEGFSAPYRAIEVATIEIGIVGSVTAKPGMFVQQGDVLAQLDSGLLDTQLQLAEAGMQARGERDAAKAEFDLRQRRSDLLTRLLDGKHARPEEVERAQSDLLIAQANLMAAEERQKIKSLEYQRIAKQIEQRTIRAPHTGWITRVSKDVGEYVGAGDPVICTVVQLDPLLITFHVSRSRAKALKPNSAVAVRFVESNREVNGLIEYLAPLIEAESGTVPVHVVVKNADGSLQAGERCELLGKTL